VSRSQSVDDDEFAVGRDGRFEGFNMLRIQGIERPTVKGIPVGVLCAGQVQTITDQRFDPIRPQGSWCIQLNVAYRAGAGDLETEELIPRLYCRYQLKGKK